MKIAPTAKMKSWYQEGLRAEVILGGVDELRSRSQGFTLLKTATTKRQFRARLRGRQPQTQRVLLLCLRATSQGMGGSVLSVSPWS
jgi:hypothetical protein